MGNGFFNQIPSTLDYFGSTSQNIQSMPNINANIGFLPKNSEFNSNMGSNSLLNQFGSNNSLQPETGLFSNFNDIGLSDIGAILTGIGSLYSDIQQSKLAKSALNFQKESYRTNLANMVKNYNANLEDRINTRYALEGKTQEDANKLIAERRL